MKYVLIIFFALSLSLIAQDDKKKEIDEKQAENLGSIDIKDANIGISMGLNGTFEDLYDARISPVDTTLLLQGISTTSFLLSTTISFPILSKWLGGGSYYRKLDENGKPYGNPYFVASGFNVLVTINLATFNTALSGSGLFNQKLDGGLGIGYTFGESVQIAVTFEMLTFRQPRDFLFEYEGKPVVVDGVNLQNLSTEDNNYFIDKYESSLSIKVVYIM